MATFTPATISFNYPKNAGVNQNTPLVIQLPFWKFASPFEFITPPWLNVVVDSFDYTTPTADAQLHVTVAVVSGLANNLPNGFYQSDFKLKIRTVPGGPAIDTVTTLATLQVFEYQNLSISPTSFVISRNVGDPNPPPDFLTIDTAFSWSIQSNKPWLSFNQSNGSGNATIQVQTDISGMSAGTYIATFIVDDGHTTKTGTVTVQIGGGSQEEYISISPESLLFSESLNEPPTGQKNVVIDSNSAVDIVANVPWLSFSNTSFAAGTNTLQVSTVNTEVLTVGSYPAEITITGTEGSKLLEVVLVIVEETTAGILNFGFYFTDDRERLNMTSGQGAAEVLLDFRADATLGQTTYKRKIPYYRNTLSVVIGLETPTLLRPFPIPNPIVNGFFLPLKPVRYDLSIFDKKIGDPNLLPRKEINSFQFINGQEPLEALKEYFGVHEIRNLTVPPFTLVGPTSLGIRRLTFLPTKITAPTDGVLALSLYAEYGFSNVGLTIQRKDAALPFASFIPINPIDPTRIYTVFIKIADYNLNPGDRLLISASILKCDVQITDNLYPTTLLIWENQWGVPETFNCTGKIEINEEDDSETVEVVRDGKEYTQVLDVKQPKSFRVNTGKIYSDAEVSHLAQILHSKKIWIEIDGHRTEVIKDFDDLTVFETRRFAREFELKFDSATR